MSSAQAGDSRRPRPNGRAARGDTIVAILLAVAAVITAAIGARSALLSDQGSDTWHKAVRDDVKRGAGLVEDVRFVYAEEVIVALQVIEAQIRERELRAAAARSDGDVAGLLRAEAGAQKTLRETFQKPSEFARPRYALEGGGYDVFRRLADRRARNPALARIDPDATEQQGSDRRREGSLLLACALPAALAFLLGALAEGFGRRRRWLVRAGFACVAVALVAALIVEIAL